MIAESGGHIIRIINIPIDIDYWMELFSKHLKLFSISRQSSTGDYIHIAFGAPPLCRKQAYQDGSNDEKETNISGKPLWIL
jgi:hypothetical protein